MATIKQRERIKELLEAFISGKRRSVEDAQELEVSIEEAFPDDDAIQDFVTDFASYRPGGGDYLYDEEAMRGKCIQILRLLAQQSGGAE